jgi:hypothetical protein
MAVTPRGNLLVSEEFGACVRLVDLNDGQFTVTNLIGRGTKLIRDQPKQETLATQCSIGSQWMLACDAAGNVFCQDGLVYNAQTRKLHLLALCPACCWGVSLALTGRGPLDNIL